MGNICRSPTGEGVLNHLIQAQHLEKQIVCDSAGTIGYHSGNPPDSRMTAAARNRGITLRGQARQIKHQDLIDFDLILTMDDENLHNVQALDPSGTYHHKIKPFCTFCKTYPDEEVPDPYYGGNAGFEHVLDLIQEGSTHIINHALKSSGS